jgi:hypothetical protein
MAHVQKHLPSYLGRVAFGKQSTSPVLVLRQPETDVRPIDHDIPTHSKENEGVKNETQDRREEHLGCESSASAQVQTPLTTGHQFAHDQVIHPTDQREHRESTNITKYSPSRQTETVAGETHVIR